MKTYRAAHNKNSDRIETQQSFHSFTTVRMRRKVHEDGTESPEHEDSFISITMPSHGHESFVSLY